MANNPNISTTLNKVSSAQLETIANNGTVTKGDNTLTASENAIYLTDEVIDSAPTQNSTNAVTSGGVYTALSGKENTSNKVTSLSNASTDTQYPSAKCVYDLVGDIETLLGGI